MVCAITRKLHTDSGAPIGQNDAVADHGVVRLDEGRAVFSVFATDDVAMTETRANVAITIFMIVSSMYEERRRQVTWGAKFLW